MNFHTMPSWRLISSELSKSVSSFAADRYVVAMSDLITCGKDLRTVKRRNASRNVSLEKSITTSKSTGLEVTKVNKQIYTLPSSLVLCFT